MDEATLERAIGAALRRQTEAANAVDLWPRVREALPAPAARRRLRFGRKGTAVLVVAGLLVAVSGVISASGAARSRIGQVIEIRGGGLHGGAAPAVKPSPDFRILGPKYVPEGLDVEQTAYVLGRGPGHTGSLISSYTSGPARPLPASSPDLARLSELARAGVPLLYIRYSSSSGPGFVEVIERRSVPGTPPPPGERVTAGSVRASLAEQDAVTTVTLVESGTWVEVATNLGRDEALAVASSLHP